MTRNTLGRRLLPTLLQAHRCGQIHLDKGWNAAVSCMIPRGRRERLCTMERCPPHGRTHPYVTMTLLPFFRRIAGRTFRMMRSLLILVTAPEGAPLAMYGAARRPAPDSSTPPK